jgi:hypothetical protein
MTGLLVAAVLQAQAMDLGIDADHVYALTEHVDGGIQLVTAQPDGGPPQLLQRVRISSDSWGDWQSVDFADTAGDADAYFQPGSSSLFFMSLRGKASPDWDIWQADWTGEAWQNVRPVAGLNSRGPDTFPTADQAGRIAFATTRQDTEGRREIWMGEPSSSGGYDISPAAGALNRHPRVSNPLLFPEGERMVVFEPGGNGYGAVDLYLSCLTEDGWSEPINLGARVNTTGAEFAPGLLEDGRWLTFSRDGVLHRIEIGALDAPAECGSE